MRPALFTAWQIIRYQNVGSTQNQNAQNKRLGISVRSITIIAAAVLKSNFNRLYKLSWFQSIKRLMLATTVDQSFGTIPRTSRKIPPQTTNARMAVLKLALVTEVAVKQFATYPPTQWTQATLESALTWQLSCLYHALQIPASRTFRWPSFAGVFEPRYSVNIL